MAGRKKERRIGFRKEAKEKMEETAKELRGLAQILEAIATEEVTVEDGLRSLGYAYTNDDEASYRTRLSTIVASPWFLATNAFRHRNLGPEDMNRVYLSSELPGMALMRDTLEIPDELYIDPSNWDEDAIWEFVERTLCESEFFIVSSKYNRGGNLPIRFMDVVERATELDVPFVAGRSESRVRQMWAKAIRKLQRAAKRESDYLIRAMYGVELKKVARVAFSVIDFLDSVKLSKEEKEQG